MEVSAWKFMVKSEEVFDDTVFGLNLRKNRDKYFSGLTEAKVEIDGTVHVFSLTQRDNFWTTCPELRDTDTTGTPIRQFLERHAALTWVARHPKHFELMPRGKGKFILESTHS